MSMTTLVIVNVLLGLGLVAATAAVAGIPFRLRRALRGVAVSHGSVWEQVEERRAA
jgi:hypothetical protein